MKDGGDEYSYCSAEKEVSGTSPTCKEDPCSKVTVENGSVVNPNPGSGDSWVWLEVKNVLFSKFSSPLFVVFVNTVHWYIVQTTYNNFRQLVMWDIQ